MRVEVSHSVRGLLQGSHGSLARASVVPGAVTSVGVFGLRACLGLATGEQVKLVLF